MKGAPECLSSGFKLSNLDPLTWRVECKECGQAWSLTKPYPGLEVKPGNLLYLLDHEASHDEVTP
jgi:hypothetical protein